MILGTGTQKINNPNHAFISKITASSFWQSTHYFRQKFTTYSFVPPKSANFLQLTHLYRQKWAVFLQLTHLSRQKWAVFLQLTHLSRQKMAVFLQLTVELSTELSD